MPSRSRAPKGCYWRGDVLYGRAQVAGHIFRWSLETDDPGVAKKLRAEFKAQVISGKKAALRRTFIDVYTAWGEWIPKQVSPSTLTRYLVSIGQLDPFLAGKHLDEINAALIATIVRGRQAADGVTNATVKRDLVALSSIMNFAQDQGWCTDNPVLPRLRRIKERRDPITLPNPADVEKLIARAPGMLGSLIAAAHATGCRQEELADAKCAQLDLKGRRLTVIGKGNKLRVIDLTPFDGFAVFERLPPGIAKAPLFRTEDGNRFQNVSSRFAGMTLELSGEDATFTRCRFHDLRHLHAVEWLRAGKSLYDLQQRLGHRSITTTEVYLKYLTPDEQRVAKGIGTSTSHKHTSAAVSRSEDLKD